MVLKRHHAFSTYEYYRQVNAFVDSGHVSVGYRGTYIRKPIDIIEGCQDFKTQAFCVQQ